MVWRYALPTLAALAALAASPARAADLSLPPPIEPEMGGWYLRGDIGFTNQNVGSLFNANYAGYDTVTNINKSFDAAPLFGLGVGYYFNHWLRFDVTGEYRANANFHGYDIGVLGAASAPDRYTGSKSEWTFMFNGYVDFGTWWNITPFIGAGVGISRNTISNFGDVSINTIAGTTSDAYGDTASKWNFAWALHAGLAYQLSRNVTLEFAYRYIDLGDAQSGDLIGYDGTNTIDNPMEFHHLTSHDLKFGVRWLLEPMPVAPLRSRG
jgi:opacity protein-like surface antigen